MEQASEHFGGSLNILGKATAAFSLSWRVAGLLLLTVSKVL